jgi:hypothetical protein
MSYTVESLNCSVPRTTTSRSQRSADRSSGSVGAIRLTTRGRVVIALVASFIILGSWLTVGGGSADASTEPGISVGGVVVVQAGESLWSIATELAPNTDPREVIMRIRDMNSLGSNHVYPGQSLAVPAF